ncbi:hypothetical protein [Ruoffia sp. FAM 20857]|uniref:hypothetical protein n=1 Tax=Ruoffia sp. FAM 20857 TaxID=3259515 RepID=UPI00388F8CD1
MNAKWQLLLVALGFVLISLSPTVPNMYASTVSGLAFIGLGWYLIRKDSRKRR